MKVNLEIVYKKVDELIPNITNPRTHDEAQIAKIAGSINEFGFNVPIGIDSKNGILTGHGRLLAAKKLGMETVPCCVLSHLSDAQRKAYIVADNRIAEKSGWDYQNLTLMLEQIKEDGLVDLVGFDESEINDLLGESDLEIEDDFDERQLMGKTEGDVFQIAFAFPCDRRNDIEAFVKEKGKEFVVGLILKAVDEKE